MSNGIHFTTKQCKVCISTKTSVLVEKIIIHQKTKTETRSILDGHIYVQNY